MFVLATLASLLVASLAPSTHAAVGLDAINAISSSTFQCLHSHGYSFFIGRVWHSYGAVDHQGIQNIKNARSAGWSSVDAYLFPCLTCQASGSAQVQSAINALRAANAQIGRLWLDIERYHWPSNTASNQRFIQSMQMGVQVGIYTGIYEWSAIVGRNYNGVSNLPLWWAAYNHHQDFTGYSPFGGWNQPSIHQYQGTVTPACGVSMDANWKP